jgi:uncharacterized membrane protein
MDKGFWAFVKEHKFTAILLVIGFILAILFFTIGFWRTLLLALILAVCFLFGYLLDQGGIEGVKDFFTKLFSRDSK